jgi:hypothetical protein
MPKGTSPEKDKYLFTHAKFIPGFYKPIMDEIARDLQISKTIYKHFLQRRFSRQVIWFETT